MKSNDLSTDLKTIRKEPDLSANKLVSNRDAELLSAVEEPTLISRDLANAFNTQIGHELGANLQYIGIAAYFQQRHLPLLAKLFFAQAEEERQHALKFVNYILDVKGELQIPTITAPPIPLGSAQEAVAAALTWEREVTAQITGLMDHAVKENDYLAQSFLQWFVNEQLEEINKMGRLLSVVRRAGENNLLMVEAYLRQVDK
ncbi:MAG TPA: ferritin [Vicinamibacterales bacterium]